MQRLAADGIEGAHQDREHDRERELAVDHTGGTGKERDRDEHRQQHQRRGEDRARQLFHRIGCRSEGLIACLDTGLNRLHHNDGVVHHQAGGQDHPQQGEFVDRKAKRLDENHCPEQGNRQGQGRHHRGLPILQEQKDDQ